MLRKKADGASIIYKMSLALDEAQHSKFLVSDRVDVLVKYETDVKMMLRSSMDKALSSMGILSFIS